MIILCDSKKDINRCIYGAPDFLAEVLSKSTRKKDLRIKASKYAAAGVREYWTIAPESKRIIVYTYKNLPDDDVEDTISIYGFHDQIPVGFMTES